MPHGSDCLSADLNAITDFAPLVYDRVCRTDFAAPGFCVLNLGPVAESRAFRQAMVALKDALSDIHLRKTGVALHYHVAGSFDQQKSTKPHLDGGPDESLLMLGYEASGVASELEFVDYSLSAFLLGLAPKDLLTLHNPMYHSGHDVFARYTKRVQCFAPADFQIVCVNNSSTPFSRSRPAWQGVLHAAHIPFPDDAKRRIIHSTMVAPGIDGPILADEIAAFVAPPTRSPSFAE